MCGAASMLGKKQAVRNQLPQGPFQPMPLSTHNNPVKICNVCAPACSSCSCRTEVHESDLPHFKDRKTRRLDYISIRYLYYIKVLQLPILQTSFMWRGNEQDETRCSIVGFDTSVIIHVGMALSLIFSTLTCLLPWLLKFWISRNVCIKQLHERYIE